MMMYNKEEVSIIKRALKQTLPLATLKQFKEGSQLFIALFEVADEKVDTVAIHVNFNWVDKEEGMFELGISSSCDIDSLSHAMHTVLEMNLAMAN